jgi:hypothetical protein
LSPVRFPLVVIPLIWSRESVNCPLAFFDPTFLFAKSKVHTIMVSLEVIRARYRFVAPVVSANEFLLYTNILFTEGKLGLR